LPGKKLWERFFAERVLELGGQTGAILIQLPPEPFSTTRIAAWLERFSFFPALTTRPLPFFGLWSFVTALGCG